MNLKQAKALKQGDLVWHVKGKNADGTAMRAKVTSIKTWKRDLDRIEVHVKRGLYEYATFDTDELNQLTTKEPEYV